MKEKNYTDDYEFHMPSVIMYYGIFLKKSNARTTKNEYDNQLIHFWKSAMKQFKNIWLFLSHLLHQHFITSTLWEEHLNDP